MKLKSPTAIVFWLTVILAVLSLFGQFGVVAGLAPVAFWMLLVAYVLLVLGVVFKGL